MHDNTVTSKTAMTRPQVLAAFRAATLSDWLDARVLDSQWDSWVPQAVKQSSATADIPVEVPGRQRNPTRLHARFDFMVMSPETQTMRQDSQPTETEMRDAMMAAWRRHPAFQDEEWPMWQRMGVETFEEFGDYWTYRLDPSQAQKKGAWMVQAVRFVYTLRTPLVEEGTPICDYHPSVERGQQALGIDYNDRRIFGHANFIPQHFAQRVGR